MTAAAHSIEQRNLELMQRSTMRGTRKTLTRSASAIERPYRVLFASGDWTCSVAHFTGHMKGPMQGPDHRGESVLRSGHLHEADWVELARPINSRASRVSLSLDLKLEDQEERQ